MSNKTQNKTATKIAKQTAPAAAVTVNVKALHSIIVADYRAMLGEFKAGQTVYTAFCAVLKAAPLSDAKALTSMLQDMKLTFGEEYVDKYVIRATIVNNARKVVHGGTKDKHVIQGRGVQVFYEAMASVNSIRDLRKAMSEAKPEALKEVKSTTGPKAGAKASDKAKADKASISTGALPNAAPDAFAVACKMLKSLEAFFAPSKTAQLKLIEQTLAMLQTEEIAVRMIKAA